MGRSGLGSFGANLTAGSHGPNSGGAPGSGATVLHFHNNVPIYPPNMLAQSYGGYQAVAPGYGHASGINMNGWLQSVPEPTTIESDIPAEFPLPPPIIGQDILGVAGGRVYFVSSPVSHSSVR